jgi:PAS domain S-box-containing protein
MPKACRSLSHEAADEETLREDVALQAILEELDNGVVVADTSGGYLLVNRKAREILQIADEEKNSTEWKDSFVFFSSDGVTEMSPEQFPLAQALQGKTTSAVDVIAQHKQSGKRLTLNVTGRPLTLPGSRSAGVILFRDVTESRQREAALQEQAKDLIGALFLMHSRNCEIGSFHHTLAHELKTPLTSVREFISIVLDGLAGPVGAAQAECLRLAMHSCDEMVRQIDDLLDSGRLETGKLEVKPVAADIARVVELTAASFRPSMAARGIRLRTEVPVGLPLALIDERRIAQVLTNLLSNSRKYAPENGEVSIKVSECPADNQCIVVEVSNNGPAIDPSHLPRIFDRLYQVHRTDATERGGLGLGLYLCRQIVQAHGGEILAKNIGKQKGVCFFLTLLKASDEIPTKPGRTLVDEVFELLQRHEMETRYVEDSSGGG